jgi:hypothetical protein
MIGDATLTLLDHDERYVMTFPSAYGRYIPIGIINLLTRERHLLSNRFSFETIIIGLVMVISEKVCFSLVFRPSLVELLAFYSVLARRHRI